jgi:hypothetical protein
MGMVGLGGPIYKNKGREVLALWRRSCGQQSGRREAVAKAKTLPPRWTSEIWVIVSYVVLLATASQYDDRAVVLFLKDDPELVHMIRVMLAAWGRVDTLGARTRTRGVLEPAIDNLFARRESA